MFQICLEYVSQYVHNNECDYVFSTRTYSKHNFNSPPKESTKCWGRTGRGTADMFVWRRTHLLIATPATLSCIFHSQRGAPTNAPPPCPARQPAVPFFCCPA